MFNTPTNSDRAQWAQSALDTFADETNMKRAGEDTGTMLSDLLADFMHLCHQEELDFATLLRTGMGAFEEEVEEAHGVVPQWAERIKVAMPPPVQAGNTETAVQHCADHSAVKSVASSEGKEIVICVEKNFKPEDGDAFDAVQSALNHFEIPATIIERDIASSAKIVIGVEGGVVRGATGSMPIDFVVYDYDVQGAGSDEAMNCPGLGGGTVLVLNTNKQSAEVDQLKVQEIFDAIATVHAVKG